MDQLALFLLFGAAMLVAWTGLRRMAIGLFCLAVVLTVADYLHHASDTLNLSF
jgi:hypothetical protein